MNIGIVKAAPAWVAEFVRGCEILKVPHKLIDIHQHDWWSQVRTLDALLWRTTLDDAAGLWEMRTKLPLIEEAGIACYPSNRMLWFYDNKVRETYFLQQNNISTPATFVSFEEQDALEYAGRTSYPVVIKTAGGASASGVALVRTRSEAEQIIREIFRPPSILNKALQRLHRNRLTRGNFLAARKLAELGPQERYVYFQEFVPAEFDWRITTLGPGLISAFKRLNRPNDFRASGSGRWVAVGEHELPISACHLALTISEQQRFTSMTYDFLETSTGYVVTEFSFSFLLNRVYSDTLFRRTGDAFVKIQPIPIGVMHLQAVLEDMAAKIDEVPGIMQRSSSVAFS